MASESNGAAPLPNPSEEEKRQGEEEEVEEEGEEAVEEVEEDEEATPTFTEESAKQTRAEGIAKFNAGDYLGALRLQHGLLKYFAAKHGETAGQCAPYYLDYGVTLLSIVQSSESEAAALAGNTGEENEDIQLCHTILELARVCYDKLELEVTDEADLKAMQLRQAEVHEALSQVHHERDDDAEALKELEFALVLRQNANPDGAIDRATIGTMFEIGLLYLRNEEFEKAEAMLTDTIEASRQCVNMPAEMIEEMQLHLDEAKEFRDQGGLDRVKQEIRDLFPSDQSLHSGATQPQASAMSLLSAVPSELASMAPSRNFVGGAVPSRENSSSLSFFPRQVLGDPTRGASLNLDVADPSKINTAVPVKRKERPRPAAVEAPPSEKRHRPEESEAPSQ